MSVRTRLRSQICRLIEVDRVQVQRVILNLIVNAIDAMGSIDGGARELLISSAAAPTDPEGVLVEVRDTGPGLPGRGAWSGCSRPFIRPKPHGLGMGLSICRSIIEAHEGRLWASANLPRGAVFQFTAPPYASEGS